MALINLENATFRVRRGTLDEMLLGNIFEDKEYVPTLTNQNKFDVIVDLGACIGGFAIWACKNLSPVKVVAVEPDRENFSLLKKNIELNKLSDKVILINAAVYKKQGSAGMNRWPLNKAKHSLNERSKQNMVTTKPLSGILSETGLEKVDYLKMDIEGSEKYVLTDDNIDLFRTRIHYLNMETHPGIEFRMKHVKEFLEKAGFRYSIRNIHWWGLLAGNRSLEALNANP